MSNRQTLSNYVYTLVNTLIQSNVEDVVISPGSRSTPLAYAFASLQEHILVHRQIDERAAAFYALGLAKEKGKPVVLLCTSGTAAANYFPAIVEAKLSRIPLIILTADRPHELREVGAPQTINQIELFGNQVKWFAEYPIPDESSDTLPYITRHTLRAVAISSAHPMGPVHINVPFREPLLIDFEEQLRKQTSPTAYLAELQASDGAVAQMQQVINESSKGIIIIGELPLNTNRAHLWAFIEKLKWPVFVESLSNMRTNIPEACLPYVISTYDAVLKNEEVKAFMKADTVIRFGAQPVSKFLMQFIKHSRVDHYVVIDEDPMFRDSIHEATIFIHAVPEKWLQQLSLQQEAIHTAYLNDWQEIDQVAQNEVVAYTEWASDEGAYVKKMLEALPDGSDLFVSSSMPIRDIDTFLLKTNKDVRIFANRGANGIDGVVSTALGVSKANPLRKTYLLIGDLAFLHDSNAFVASKYQACQLQVIVMNNDGGGIFSYLPQATIHDHYEHLFGTPTALTFKDLAAMYGLRYTSITNNEALISEKVRSVSGAIELIEVFTNREENTKAHRKLWANISKELVKWLTLKAKN